MDDFLLSSNTPPKQTDTMDSSLNPRQAAVGPPALIRRSSSLTNMDDFLLSSNPPLKQPDTTMDNSLNPLQAVPPPPALNRRSSSLSKLTAEMDRDRRRRNRRGRTRSRSPCRSLSPGRSLSPVRMIASAVTLGSLSGSLSGSQAFAPTASVTSSTNTRAALSASWNGPLVDRPATSLNMFPSLPSFNLADAASSVDLPTFHLADAASSVADAAAPVLELFSGGDNAKLEELDIEVEAEGLNLVSHALLDVDWKQMKQKLAQATVAARAAEVAGRLFALGQGLLPGHEIPVDELAFQVAFLAVSCNTLYQTAMPKIKASQASQFMTPGDRKAYRKLFQPTGMSWTEFREMSLHSMEWVELNPGQELTLDHAYWLYQGDINDVEGTEVVSDGLLGDDHIARTLGLFNGEQVPLPPKRQVAGANGAKVLKVNTEDLAGLMKQDEGLKGAVTRLLFNNMRDKIQRGVEQQPRAA